MSAFLAPAGPAEAESPSRSDLERASPDAELSGFTEWEQGADGTRLARSQLRLAGMHCAACAEIIEQALVRCAGVVEARVNGASERLSLLWNPQRTSLSALQDAIRRAGYEAVPDLAAPARKLRKQAHRQALWRLFVAGFLMMQVMMLAWPSYVAKPGEITPDQLQLLNWGQWVLTLPAMLLAAGPFFSAAWAQLRQRKAGMDVPVSLGLLVAFVASTGVTLDPGGPFGHEVYYDSVTMFLSFLLAGRYLELRARQRAAEALEQGAAHLPDKVERLDPDGRTQDWVRPELLQVGDLIRVPAGQSFPADAVVTQGASAADEALLSGEATPQPKAAGDAVLAGSLNLQAPLLLRVTRVGEDTRHAAIVRLMRQALTQRPGELRMADRVAGPFIWAVLLIAGLAAVAWQFVDPSRALAVSVAVLIVTCPCALSLAAPSAWLGAAGGLARRGVLLSRLDALEHLARVDTLVLDKTGTLSDERTHAQPCWSAALPQARHDEALLHAVALAQASRHPRAQGLLRSVMQPGEAAQAAPDGGRFAGGLDPQALPTADHWQRIQEFPGQGLLGVDADGRSWRLGSPAWVSTTPLPVAAQLALSLDGEALLAWRFEEGLRDDAKAAVQAMRARGLRVLLLSGDALPRVAELAEAAGIDEWQAAASPEDKLTHVRALQQAGHRVLMLGDGINDAPVLAQADVSLAMGQGAELARARADGILLSGRLLDVVAALQKADDTRRVIRQNLAWAAAYNAACIPLALVGWLPPWAAGLGMALSSLLVVANAMRLGRNGDVDVKTGRA